jgi:hypothetical protein
MALAQELNVLRYECVVGSHVKNPKAEGRNPKEIRMPEDLLDDRSEIAEPDRQKNGGRKKRVAAETPVLVGETHVRFAKQEVEY